ncbi:M66 family metalloprotease [Vibrio sp. CUB2]|uniref:M66 family metalloprotease n=1 Tax=Vibrio sp. CUB2 TaxID=2315233 RepID=UPI00076A6D04|nr:M66 family metalloprotease [Vibrio sp. CUB2]
MKTNKVSIGLSVACGLLFTGVTHAQVIPFNNNQPTNDLQGDFEAMVIYAQNITVPHHNDKGDPRPHLTALRDILLLVKPVENVLDSTQVKVIGRDANGEQLGVLSLNPPEQIPSHDGPNLDITYAQDMWSVTLPATWVQPGLTLELLNGSTSGVLSGLDIGAPNELLINTMDLGMLTNPRGRFYFADNPERHRDYFQKIPVSKLIVNPYETVKLNEVMLPDGRLLTELDPSTGTWHKGDMRAYTTKILMSHGINLANYGINSSTAISERAHPYTANQITAIAAVGRYQNGVVAHGGSGGNGMVTIDSSLGNEWSHEVGHNFGLGHWPGGTDGTTHRPSTDINSAWGWDQFQQRFIANFMWNKRNGQDQVCCTDGIGIPAFEGYKFNRDAMGGGEPTSPISKYTLHTPFVLEKIQTFMEKKATFDEASPTGFSKWNDETKTMQEFEQPALLLAKSIASQSQLNTIKDDTAGSVLLGYINDFDITKVETGDGRWIRDIYLPSAANVVAGKVVNVARYSGYGVTVHINGQSVNLNRGDSKFYISDGKDWQETSEAQVAENNPTRVPTDSGVAVTTLVGYYDPQQTLNSYIFPALHGAYGFVYQPTPAESLNTNGCYVRVYNGRNYQTDNYQLVGFRYDDNVMNKFHINLKQADAPTRAEVVCDNTVLSSLDIEKPKQDLKVSIIQSDSLTDSTPTENSAPVAHAGEDQSVLSGAAITLSAEQSADADGDELTYLWKQISGLPATIQSTDKVNTSVILPESNKAESYVFSVTVFDGKASSEDTVMINAQPQANQNHAPQVSLPQSMEAKSGAVIEIAATASDQDGDVLSYQWHTSDLAYQPVSVGTIRVKVPEVTVDSQFTVLVVVSDPTGESASSSTVVRVKANNNACSISDSNAANYAVWSASKSYSGGDLVSYKQLVWKAKYWSQNNQPDNSDVWELISDVALPWSTQKAYSGGDQVTYNGVKYEAKWWTRGDQPDVSSVWTGKGSACQ